MRIWKLGVAAMLLTATAPAFGQWRELDVPGDKGWQHARTELILMPTLGRFQRTGIKDNGQSEFDISAAYDATDRKSTATVFIYRPGMGDLPCGSTVPTP